MKVHAAVVDRMGMPSPCAGSRALAIRTVDLDPPGPGEGFIKVAAAGLCHSDLAVINGEHPRPMPMALGYGASGIGEELGEGVEDLQRGDHVVVVFVPSCGHCRSLVMIDHSVPLDEAALFGCAVLTGVGAADSGSPSDRSIVDRPTRARFTAH